MATITSQDWDGVSAPSLPSGWTYDSGFATSTAASVSPPNALTVGSTGPLYAYYATPDGNGGNVRVKASFTIDQLQPTTGVYTYVFARGADIGTPGGRSLYYAGIDFELGVVFLGRLHPGGGDILDVLSAPFIGPYAAPLGTWFAVQLVALGSSLAVNIQDLSGGLWLQPSGTWGVTQADCLTASDTALTGEGYGGVMLHNVGDPSLSPYSDDFLFETIDNPATAARRPAVVVRPGHVFRD